MRTRRGFAAMALVACVGAGRPTAAQTGDRAASEPAVVRRVEIAFAGSPEAYSAFEGALHELFGRTHIVAVVRLTPEADWKILNARPAPGSAAPLARAFVDLRGRNAVVIVADGATHDVIERRDLPPSGSLEMTVEETSHVIYGVVDSLLRSPHAPAPEPEPQTQTEAARTVHLPIASTTESAIVEPSSTPSSLHSPPPWGIDGRFLGQLSAPGSSMMLLGVGAGVEIGLMRTALRPGLQLSGSLYMPARARLDDPKAEADVHLFAFRLASGLDLFRTSSVVARVGAGGGVDWFRMTPESAPAEGSAHGEASYVDPVVSALLDTKIRVSSGLALAAGLSVDLDVAPHYPVVRGAKDLPLFEPARFRPSFFAGVSFPVLSAPEPVARARSEQAIR